MPSSSFSFPYPTKIFKEKGITKKDAFENLKNDMSPNGFKKYIISTVDDRIIINREFQHTYFKSDGISNFYTEKQRFECNFGDKKSPIEVWEEIISKDIKKKQSFSSYEELENYIQTNYSHVYRTCNTFNPYIVGYFLLNFKGVESVLDPSAGWGDRLVGFLAAAAAAAAVDENSEKANAFSYTGFDPNYKLEDAYKKIIKDFATKKVKATVEILPFEEASLEENSFDMTLTSPPFFDLEVYDATSSTQSITKNKTYSEWIDNFYKIFLQKICFATSKYIVIYTSNYKQYKLVEDTASIIEKCGKFKRVKTTRYFFNTTGGIKMNPREIFVWERNSESSLVEGPDMLNTSEEKNTSFFPYHYYDYGSSVKESMYSKIKECRIKFHNNSTKDVYPQFIELKANQKVFEQSFLTNNKNTFKEEGGCGWKEDVVIDFYNEEARMNATGYGYDKTPLEIWNNAPLRKEYGVTSREDFYTKQMEARLAYASQSKGIFEYIGKTFFNNSKNKEIIKVLDIAAYGDRMLAACSVTNYNFVYTGIDPDTRLKYDSLIQDINLFYNKNPVFFNTSFENFCLRDFDVVLVSPPPYKAEKYDSSSESQSHNMYPSFEQWVNGFLINTVIRKVATTYKPKVFAFTALDRLKGKKEGYLISYVEILFYCISLLTQYEYHSTLQLNTSAGTPWFFFVLKEEKEENKKAFTPLVLLKSFFETEYYRKIICNSSKIFQNMLLLLQQSNRDFLTSYYLEERKVPISKNCSITYITTKENFFINPAEKIRYEVVRYVCNNLFETLEGKVPFNKLLTFFSRWLMGAASFCTPLERFLSCDIMFPDITNSDEIVKACGEQFIENVMENVQSFDINLLKEIVYSKYFLFEAQSHFKEVAGPGLAGLVKTCGIFLYHTTLTALDYYSGEKERSKKRYIPFTVKKTDGTVFQETDPLPEKRYKALGAVGHHFTRPIKRTEILREALGEKVCVDLFATYKNSNSLGTAHYFSLYPDVEEGSLGNVFYITEFQGGLYLANALDSKYFVEYTARFLNRFLSVKGSEVTFITSGVVWKDTVDFKNIEKYFTTGDKEKIFKPSNFPTQAGFRAHSEINKDFIKAAFILDQFKFPSVEDPYEKDIRQAMTTRNQQMISFGIVLSNKKKFTVDREIFSQIGDIGVYE